MPDTSQAYTADPDSWAAHLDDDETLVWTGDPITAFRWYTYGTFASLMFLAQITFALFLVSLISMAIGYLAQFGLPVAILIYLAPGVALLGLLALWKWLMRRSAHYALTNKRAIVAQSFPFKRLLSYPIYRDKPLVIGKTNPKSLYFAHTRKQLKFTSYRIFQGFEHLADFDTALERATSVQQAAPFRPASYMERAFKWTSKSRRASGA